MKLKILALLMLMMVLVACRGGVTLVGDANEDGRLDVMDITTVELMVDGVLDATPGADVNGDGLVNILDIAAMEILIAENP